MSCKTLGFTLASCLLVLAATPTDAEACSRACPAGETTPPAAASMPANAGVFYWRTPSPQTISKSDVGLTLQSGAGPGVSVPFQMQVPTQPNLLIVEPTAGWQPNSNYRLTGDNCSSSGIDVSFSTGATAPLPDKLGTLKLVDKSRDTIGVEHGASCSRDIFAAQARFRVDLSAEAQPWSDVIRYQTFVDGKPWQPREISGQFLAPGTSWKGRGEDVVYAACNTGSGWTPSPNLAPGQHTVWMEAYVESQNQTKTFATNKVTFTLSCGTSEPAADTGTDAGPDAGPDTGPDATDSGRPDANDAAVDADDAEAPDTASMPDSSIADTTVTTDAAPDSDTVDQPDTEQMAEDTSGDPIERVDTTGCSCSSNGAPRPGTALLLAVGLALLGGRRLRVGSGD